MPASTRRHKATPRQERDAQTRRRAFAALALMRREGMSLARACRLEHIKPSTFLRHLGSSVRRDTPGGRFQAKAGDRFSRDLQIPTALGVVPISVRGSKQASFLAQYLSAVGRYLRTGDEQALEKFKGKAVAGQPLITDASTLSALAEADALHLDRLYASVARAS